MQNLVDEDVYELQDGYVHKISNIIMNIQHLILVVKYEATSKIELEHVV